MQAGIDVAGYGIPCLLGAKRLLRSACNLIGFAVSLDESIQTAMPVIITLIIAEENELITLVIDGTFARTWVGAILLLILRKQFGVEHRHFHFMFHCQFIGLLLILFFTFSHAGLPDTQHCRIVPHISMNRLFGMEKLSISERKN